VCKGKGGGGGRGNRGTGGRAGERSGGGATRWGERGCWVELVKGGEVGVSGGVVA